MPSQAALAALGAIEDTPSKKSREAKKLRVTSNLAKLRAQRAAQAVAIHAQYQPEKKEGENDTTPATTGN